MVKAICVKECWDGRRFYKRGQEKIFADVKDVDDRFKVIEEIKPLRKTRKKKEA